MKVIVYIGDRDVLGTGNIGGKGDLWKGVPTPVKPRIAEQLIENGLAEDYDKKDEHHKRTCTVQLRLSTRIKYVIGALPVIKRLQQYYPTANFAIFVRKELYPVLERAGLKKYLVSEPVDKPYREYILTEKSHPTAFNLHGERFIQTSLAMMVAHKIRIPGEKIIKPVLFERKEKERETVALIGANALEDKRLPGLLTALEERLKEFKVTKIHSKMNIEDIMSALDDSAIAIMYGATDMCWISMTMQVPTICIMSKKLKGDFRRQFENIYKNFGIVNLYNDSYTPGRFAEAILHNAAPVLGELMPEWESISERAKDTDLSELQESSIKAKKAFEGAKSLVKKLKEDMKKAEKAWKDSAGENKARAKTALDEKTQLAEEAELEALEAEEYAAEAKKKVETARKES